MMTWNEKKINNIETNPIECWWAIGNLADGCKRMYIVEPYYEVTTDGLAKTDKPYKYYTLSECLSHHLLTKDKTESKEYLDKSCFYGDYYIDTELHPIAIYDTKEDAMLRAETQIKHMDAIWKTYFSKEGN